MTARSYLYVPGDQLRMLERAARSDADAIIADQEDAVAPARKVDARRTVAEWLAVQIANGRPEIWVRVNSSDLIAADVHAVIVPTLIGVRLPKVEAPEQIQHLSELAAAE